MNQYEALIRSVENQFELVVDPQSITALQRPYATYLITLKFSTPTGESYLLKEYDSFVPHHLQVVFSALEPIRDHKPQLAFPICSRAGLYHVSDQDGRNFQLLEFLDLAPFDPKKVSLQHLFSQLARLHENLAQCHIPANQYSDLRAYVVLGSRRIQQRYGAGLPFLPKLESFGNRLPHASLRQRVRHGDIQETNVCLQGDEVVFVDCDTVHFGYPLLDYIQGAVMYLDRAKVACSENQAIAEALWQQIKGETPGLTRQDVRYLLARVMLGPIQGGDIQPGQERLNSFLLDLDYFCEGGD